MRRAALAAWLLLPLASCRSAAHELTAGPGGRDAPRAFVEALADRFGPIDRDPAYDALRRKLNRMSFAPSRGFDDPAAWTAKGPGWREVDLVGRGAGGAYRIGVRAAAPRPSSPGSYWNRIRLQRLGAGRYEWTVSEELAVGPVAPSALASALDVVFRAAERMESRDSRSAVAAAFPRTASTLGLLLRLDTLVLERDAPGSTYVRLGVRVTPAGIKAFAPRGAAYIEKYAGPLTLQGALVDAQRATWWTIEAADRLWTLRLRIRDGSLVPLAGASDRRLPARLRAVGDISTRMGRFGVGAKGVTADVSLTRTGDEKGISARLRREPDWKLPFLVEALLDSPLAYPFEDAGTQVDWAVRATDRGTILTGLYRTRVRETWLLRWLGGLMGHAIDEFRAGAEQEVDRYLRDCLLALRDDVTALAAVP